MKKRQILAIIGIILLVAMYVATMVFAIMDSPKAKGLLVGSIFLTIVVPVILHFIIRSADYYKKRQEEAFEEHDKARRALEEMVENNADEAAGETAENNADETAGEVPEDAGDATPPN